MSGIYLSVHPFLERLANEGVDHVADVLSRKMVNLLVNTWQGPVHIDILLAEWNNVLKGEPLKLRHAHVFYVLAVNPQSLSTAQVTHMPDCDALVGGQVDTTIMREEFIDLALLSVLGGEVFGGDLNLLINE